jgi:Mg-chelatase subunit ChlD
MRPASKRRLQLGMGIAVFAFAVIVSYFSVVETDTEDTLQYDIYLVVDVSGSMGTITNVGGYEQVTVTSSSPIVFAKQAALEFVDAFRLDDSSNHRIGLAIFYGGEYEPPTPKAEIVVGLNESSKLKEGIESLFPGGATAMGDGILIATKSLAENTRLNATKIIVLLSDGVSNVGEPPLLASSEAKENDITIFSVGYGSNADVMTLKAVASMTDGKYYDASTGQDLADAFGEIAGVLISPISHYSSRILILLAIPILLFIPTIEKGFTTMMRIREDKPLRKTESSTKWSCTSCNHVNRSTSKFCGKCGELMKTESSTKWSCTSCNHVNRSTSKFCGKCGELIKTESTAKWSCTSCNHVNRSTSKFCGKCGKSKSKTGEQFS